MLEIVLEKIHSPLQYLADYVMSEIPILKQDVGEPKQDVSKIRIKVGYIIEGKDTHVRELDIIRTQQASTECTLHVDNE
jgi:hypothetical protein